MVSGGARDGSVRGSDSGGGASGGGGGHWWARAGTGGGGGGAPHWHHTQILPPTNKTRFKRDEAELRGQVRAYI